MAISKKDPQNGKAKEGPSQVTLEENYRRTKSRLMDQLDAAYRLAKKGSEIQDNFTTPGEVCILDFLRQLCQSQLYQAAPEFEKLWNQVELIYDLTERKYLELNPVWEFQTEEDPEKTS